MFLNYSLFIIHHSLFINFTTHGVGEMKIIHILTDSNVGGAGILLENLLKHTSLPKEDITVALPRGAAMAERYASCGVGVEEMNICPDRSFSPRDLPYLTSFLRERKPDILHTHAALGARWAAFRAGVPLRLATRHCAYPVSRINSSLPLRLLRRATDRALTHLTVATAYAAEENLCKLGIPRKKILLIRNGAEPLAEYSYAERAERREALGISQDAFVVGAVGRLVPVKGHMTLLSAARILLSRHTGYRFLLVGGGEEEERLRRAALAPPLRGRVIFTGEVRDTAPYVNLFDVAVNCSVGTETSCLALSEAMSIGLPCIASDFGGNPELVHEGENGLLFPVGDAAALAACIERLREDSALRHRLSVGAKKRFLACLNAEAMAREYDALYRRLFREFCTKAHTRTRKG